MKKQHTDECLGRINPNAFDTDTCEFSDCNCACHADPEPFDPEDNRYKWPEDRR